MTKKEFIKSFANPTPWLFTIGVFYAVRTEKGWKRKTNLWNPLSWLYALIVGLVAFFGSAAYLLFLDDNEGW